MKIEQCKTFLLNFANKDVNHEINEWLSESRYEVVDRLQSESEGEVTITIFYKKEV